MNFTEATIISSFDPNTNQTETRYFDRNGTEIKEGDQIKLDVGGSIETVYRTEDGQLGVDATNKRWLENGRAYPCQYGIYPFNIEDMRSCTKYVEG